MTADEAKSEKEAVTVLGQATHALIATILMRYLDQQFPNPKEARRNCNVIKLI